MLIGFGRRILDIMIWHGVARCISCGSGRAVNKQKCTTGVTGLLICALLSIGASGQSPKAPLKHLSFEIGLKFSTLGVGIDAAVPVTYHSNLRVGFNAFNYSRDERQDGVLYSGEISFRSVQATYDWFPLRGTFHLSPGLLVYNGNRLTAKASVPSGQVFTLQSANYVSDPTNPVHGKASVNFFKVNPMMLVGWRNLIPRLHRFEIPFEFGIIYDGTPRTFLELSGGACDPTGANCRNIRTDPTIQSNIQFVRHEFERKVSPFKVYPVVSVGLSIPF